MFKSKMCSLYNKIYSDNRSKKVFNDRFKKICMMLDDEEFYKKLQINEKRYYDLVIKEAIDGKKNLRYETVTFFLPLIHEYDSKVINKTNYTVANEFYEWILKLEKAQRLVRSNSYKYIKEIYLESKINRIRVNEKLTEYKKSELINSINKMLEKELLQIEDAVESNFCISGGIYVKIYDFIIEGIEKNNNIQERAEEIIKYVKFTAPIIRLNIVPKLEKVLKKELLMYKNGEYKIDATHLGSIEMVDILDLSEKAEIMKRELSLMNSTNVKE